MGRLALHCALAFAVVLAATTAFGADSNEPVIVPTRTVSLFNGKDLSSFYTWLVPTGYRDPHGVFTVADSVDGGPAIRISGQDKGGLITRQKYGNYKLVAEYRWGSSTLGPGPAHARDSGILVHCFGEDGNRNPTFTAPYMGSIEVQICEGATGDFYLLSGYRRGYPNPIAPTLTVNVSPGTRKWNPEGIATEFNHGRIDWRFRDPRLKDTFGYRGSRDVERLVGEWNTIEVICRKGDISCSLNGVEVNSGTGGSMIDGRILFQSEGAEIFFRRIELQSLDRE